MPEPALLLADQYLASMRASAEETGRRLCAEAGIAYPPEPASDLGNLCGFGERALATLSAPLEASRQAERAGDTRKALRHLQEAIDALSALLDGGNNR